MKSNKQMFEELLDSYKNQKADIEQKEKTYSEIFNLWDREVEMNGDWTEKAEELGKLYDKAVDDLEESRASYNNLAHDVLKYYLLVQQDEIHEH